MKTMRYIWNIVAALLLVACEENLTAFDVSAVTIEAEWKEGDLHLSSSVDVASGNTVVEQGFVLELPVFGWSGWRDSSNAREKRTIRVESASQVSYVLQYEGWDPGLECTAYAYVKTSAGNFRSRMIKFNTVEIVEPVITNITHRPSEQGPFRGGGTVIVEGSRFVGKAGIVKVFMQKYLHGYLSTFELEIEELTTERIVAHYPGGQWGYVGEYEVKLVIGTNTFVANQKMVIEGINILSIEPERPHAGEVVKMYLENFTPGSIRYLKINVLGLDLEILEETDSYITFRAPEYPADSFTVELCDQRNLWSEPFVMQLAPLWEEMDLAQVGLESETLGQNFMNTLVHGNDYTWHDNKTFILDYNRSRMLVFDGAAVRWSEIALPDIHNSEWILADSQLFGHGDCLYMYVKIIFPGNQEHPERIIWQYLYCLDLPTGQWRLVEELDNDLLSGEDISMAAVQDGVVYASVQSNSLMEYHLADGVWKDSALDLPPLYSFLGSEGHCLFYHGKGGDNGVYGVDVRGGQPWRVMEGYYYPKKNRLVANGYFYYQENAALYRVPLYTPDAELERLGVPFLGIPAYQLENGFGVFVPSSEALYFIWQVPGDELRFYRYNK